MVLNFYTLYNFFKIFISPSSSVTDFMSLLDLDALQKRKHRFLSFGQIVGSQASYTNHAMNPEPLAT